MPQPERMDVNEAAIRELARMETVIDTIEQSMQKSEADDV